MIFISNYSNGETMLKYSVLSFIFIIGFCVQSEATANDDRYELSESTRSRYFPQGLPPLPHNPETNYSLTIQHDQKPSAHELLRTQITFVPVFGVNGELAAWSCNADIDSVTSSDGKSEAFLNHMIAERQEEQDLARDLYARANFSSMPSVFLPQRGLSRIVKNSSTSSSEGSSLNQSYSYNSDIFKIKVKQPALTAACPSGVCVLPEKVKPLVAPRTKKPAREDCSSTACTTASSSTACCAPKRENPPVAPRPQQDSEVNAAFKKALSVLLKAQVKK